jgi:hypothetical protein
VSKTLLKKATDESNLRWAKRPLPRGATVADLLPTPGVAAGGVGTVIAPTWKAHVIYVSLVL